MADAYERWIEKVAEAAVRIAQQRQPNVRAWEDMGVHDRAALIGAVRTQAAIEEALGRHPWRGGRRG